MTDLDKLAKSLTKAQREMVLASEPGGWGCDDTVCGVPLNGPGFATARALERKGIGEHTFGSEFEDLYFNNQTGLALRNHLKGQNDGTKS